jgi:rhodanese-related sulfurtransferase
MPAEIGREQARQLIDGGAQLVEVLPAEAHRKEHLPGAISIPLAKVNAETTASLDRHRPLIVYCYDTQ